MAYGTVYICARRLPANFVRLTISMSVGRLGLLTPTRVHFERGQLVNCSQPNFTSTSDPITMTVPYVVRVMMTLSSFALTQIASPSFNPKRTATWCPVCIGVGDSWVATRAALCIYCRALPAKMGSDTAVVAGTFWFRLRTNMDARGPAFLERSPSCACPSPRSVVAWGNAVEGEPSWFYEERLRRN